ncbi:MAG TPA: FKBP-type peptidyl-prolyl cis-trans isomerase [Solirubrobacteraceae bacterium]
MNKLIRPMTLALIVAFAALVLAACGSSTQQSQADKAAQQAQAELKNPPTVTDVATPTVKAVVVKPSAGEADINKKPVIPKQTGAAPTSLVAQDLIVGKGATAAAGDQVSMQYVGVLRDNGKEFDSSWKRNKAFDFALGGGQVIPGWDQGIVGMKVGGRRRLIIPADLAYGAQGQPPTIPANAALVFDVDLKKVTAAKQ